MGKQVNYNLVHFSGGFWFGPHRESTSWRAEIRKAKRGREWTRIFTNEIGADEYGGFS